MKKRGVLLWSIALGVVVVIASVLAAAKWQSRGRAVQNENVGIEAKGTPDSSPTLQASMYKVSASFRAPNERSERIILISIEPENFTRDKMLLLARQLNRDFPDEPRLYAVIFDSEIAARNYDPAGGSYSFSKKLERGEYDLDRVKGRERINFSTRRGNPVDEIKIVISDSSTPGKKRRRASH